VLGRVARPPADPSPTNVAAEQRGGIIMRRFLQKVFGPSSANGGGAAQVVRARPGVESLESRDVPAGGINLAVDGTLTITGTIANDTITINPSGSEISVWMTHSGHTEMWKGQAALVSKIKVYGSDGNDLVVNGTSKFSEYFMGNGNDVVYGGYGDDVIHGGAGDDKLYGGYGQDKLYGDGGTDVLYGQYGNDYLDGGYDVNEDYLIGGSGMDTFVQHYTRQWWGGKTYYHENLADFNSGDGDTKVWVGHGSDIWPW
jgi:Ca2+-binding RTX toxin-like protein